MSLHFAEIKKYIKIEVELTQIPIPKPNLPTTNLITTNILEWLQPLSLSSFLIQLQPFQSLSLSSLIFTFRPLSLSPLPPPPTPPPISLFGPENPAEIQPLPLPPCYSLKIRSFPTLAPLSLAVPSPSLSSVSGRRPPNAACLTRSKLRQTFFFLFFPGFIGKSLLAQLFAGLIPVGLPPPLATAFLLLSSKMLFFRLQFKVQILEG